MTLDTRFPFLSSVYRKARGACGRGHYAPTCLRKLSTLVRKCSREATVLFWSDKSHSPIVASWLLMKENLSKASKQTRAKFSRNGTATDLLKWTTPLPPRPVGDRKWVELQHKATPYMYSDTYNYTCGTHRCMYTCVHTCTSIHMYTNTNTHTHTHTTHTHTHTHTLNVSQHAPCPHSHTHTS